MPLWVKNSFQILISQKGDLHCLNLVCCFNLCFHLLFLLSQDQAKTQRSRNGFKGETWTTSPRSLTGT